MKLNKKLLATGVLAASMFAGQAWGAVSAEEAAKLGNSLTPMGAEKAGNGGEEAIIEELAANKAAVSDRATSARINNPAVKDRMNGLTAADAKRKAAFAE